MSFWSIFFLVFGAFSTFVVARQVVVDALSCISFGPLKLGDMHDAVQEAIYMAGNVDHLFESALLYPTM